MNKEVSHRVCLSVILTGSVFKMGKNYYPQVFLMECKFCKRKQDVQAY